MADEMNRLGTTDDGIEAKRASLLHAKGELKRGRREEPTEDPAEKQARKRRLIWGTALTVVALIAVFVLIQVLAADISLDGLS